MGLASKSAAPGDASATAPFEPFDEAAAYAREQAAANANTGPAVAPDTNETAPGAAAATPAAATTQPQGQAQPMQHAPPQAPQQHPAPPSGQQWANPGNPTQPVHGVPVRGPTATPHPQHVIVGYALVTPQDSCSCDLRLEGWLVVLILLLTFPCVAWIPCMIPDCFQPYQVPIYGPPGSVPIAQPYYA